MKKMLSVVLMVVMVMVLTVGCQSNDSTKAASERTVDDVKKAGKLKAGVKSDIINMGMINTKTGKYEGYEIDIAYEIAAKIFDCTYEEAVKQDLVEFTSVTAKTRGGLLDNGELDCVIAGFTVTEERKKSWSFTQQYRLEPVTFLVRKDAGVKALADMDGFIIGVGQGTTTAELIQEYVEDKQIDINYEIQDFQYIADGVAALKTDQIDAYSVDRSALVSYLDDSLMLTEDVFGVQDIGIALNINNKQLTKAMDDVLTELKGNGALDKLKEKWDVLTDDKVCAGQ